MLKRAVAFASLVALCASCQKFAEGRQMFRELLALRDEIAAEFHEKVVDVTVMNGDRLTIKFINSPLLSASSEERQKRADDVATFVAKHYKHPVAAVTTVFVVQSGGLGVSANTSDSYVGHPKP